VLLPRAVRLYACSLGAWSCGQHAIDLLGKLVERDCARDCDCRLFISGPTSRPHQDKAWGAMKSPSVRLLAILENGLKILPFVETLGKGRLI
jgi:hypothetical protein